MPWIAVCKCVWVKARKCNVSAPSAVTSKVRSENKWQKPEYDTVKINLDASVFIGAHVGPVLMDQIT